MEKFKKFIKESETFGGFVFKGCFDMSNDLFFKIYDIYTTDNINLLDYYSEYIYLKWYKFYYDCPEIWDRNRTNKVDQALFYLRKYKLVDSQELGDLRSKLKEIIKLYDNYL